MQSFVEYVLNADDNVSPKLRHVREEGHKADNSINNLGDTLGTVLGGIGLGYAISQLFEYGGELQKVEKSFEVLLQSRSEASEMLSEVSEYAKSTNFGKMGLAQSAKDLLTYGVEAEKVMPTLKTLGDVSLGNQEKLKLLSYAYAQTQAAGKLMGQDLLQMINAGFNPLQVISEQTGKSMGELRKEMENGAISADMVAESFRIATSEGHRFYNGAEAMADSGAGHFDRMKETIFETAQVLGGELLNAAIPVFDAITGLFDFMGENQGLFLSLAAMAGTLVTGIWGISAATRVWAETQKIVNALAAANPIGLVIVGVMALTAAVVTAYNKFEGFRALVDGVWNVLKSFGLAMWEYVQEPLEKVKNFLSEVVDGILTFIDTVASLAGSVGLDLDFTLPGSPVLDTIGALYKEGADKSREEFNKEEKEGDDKNTNMGAGGDDATDWGALLGGKDKEGSTGLGSGLSEISAAGPKTFNITIEKIAGIETLHTSKISQAFDQLEDNLKRILLNVLNDAQAQAV